MTISYTLTASSCIPGAFVEQKHTCDREWWTRSV